MKKTFKSILSVILVITMIMGMSGICAVSATEDVQTQSEDRGTPNATVSILKPLTLTEAEHDYMTWPSGDDTVDRPLQMVMNFKANETMEEAAAGPFADFKCDFYLTFTGIENGSFIADGCYLAGNYGSFGWIVIPADGLELEDGVEYPVMAAYDANLKYAQDICGSVKDFTAAIYVAPEILEANPDFAVSLALKMTNPEDETDIITVGEPAVFSAKALGLSADVPAVENDGLANEANLNAIEDARAELLTLGVTEAEAAVAVPTIDITIVSTPDENGVIVYNVAPTLAADGKSVKMSSFAEALTFRLPVLATETKTAANVYHDGELIGTYDIIEEDGQKFVEVSSDSFSEFAVEPVEVDRGTPNATVSILKPLTLTDAEHDYMTWPSGDDTVDRPLQMVMNFKANETMEEAAAGPFADFKCDFYLTFTGIENGSFIADGCYLAGNYGSFGWIVIPADGLELEDGVEYPVMAAYDANLKYAQDICGSVKDFTAAIYVAPEILEANPDFAVSLALKMTNPEDETDIITVGEPAVFSAKALGLSADVPAVENDGLANEANLNAIEDARAELLTLGVTEAEAAVAVPTIDITIVSTPDENGVIVYNVAPTLAADGKSVKMSSFAEALTFRLPVLATETKTAANVYHDGELLGTYDIMEENGQKFVEVSSDSFSEYTVEPVEVEEGLSGTGTEADPFLINDIDDLKWFRDDVNNGNDYKGLYVKLTADIDLNNEEWTPIGYMGKAFKGNFDGGEFTVKNLKITKTTTNSAENNTIGFFGKTLDTAVIKNLTIENVDITGSLYVGAIVGYGYTGKLIENCTVKGNITIDAWWYAGVIGGNGYLALVNNCHVIGSEDGTSYIKGNNGSYIGGIWGFRGEGDNQIINCTVSNLSITGVDRVGGIAGIGHYGNTVSGCGAEAVTVTATDPEATTVGLIVGAAQGTSSEPTVITGNDTSGITAQIDNGDGTYTTVNSTYGTNIDGSTAVTNYVASINGVQYETLADAAADAQADDTITLIADATIAEGTDVTIPDGVTLNGNGFSILASGADHDTATSYGYVVAGGNLTIEGVTKIEKFSAGYYNHIITVGEGASLQVTGKNRVSLGYGSSFDVTGTIADAKTADKSTITPSLVVNAGFSIVGANDTYMKVTDAYVKIGSTSSKNSNAGGQFDISFTNSIVEFTNQFTTSAPKYDTLNPVFNVTFEDSVVTTSTKLCLMAPGSNVVVDNSDVTLGTYLHNSGNLTIENGSTFVGSMIQYGENGGNSGTITVDNASFTIKNNNSAYAMDGNNTGKLVLLNGATASVDYITETAITLGAGSSLTSKSDALEVETDPAYEVKYENGQYILVNAPAAKIGETGYDSFTAAYEAAQNGDTITLYADAYLTGKLYIAKEITIDGNGHSIIADANAVWYTVTGKLNIKNYKTHLIGVNANNITLKDITLDCNDNAAGINIYCAQNVVFDNVAIINATKGYASLTVNGSTLTVKNAFTATDHSVAMDISNGSGVTSTLGVTVEEGTVFDLADKTIKYASVATVDMTAAVNADGEPYFAAKDSAYLYTENQMNSRTTDYSNGLTLLADVTLNKDLKLSGGTLDLNGNDLTVADGYVIQASGNVTITGEGTVNADAVLASETATLTAPANINVTSAAGKVVYKDGVYVVVDLIEFDGTTMTLGASLSLDFAIDTAMLDGTDNYAVLTHDYADGRTETITVPQSEWAVYSGTVYTISFSGLAAKQMNDNVTVTVYNAEDEAVSVTFTDSIIAYATRMLGTDEVKANAELMTLYVDMLNYGAAAQVQFEYDIENLANANLTDEQKAYATRSVETTDNRVMGTGYVGSTLTLESEIELDLVFANNKVGSDYSTLYAIVTYTDHYGHAKEVRIEGVDFIKYGSIMCQVSITDMAVADFRSVVSCTVYNADGEALANAADSVESYANRNAESLGAIVDTIVKFGESSYNYFH